MLCNNVSVTNVFPGPVIPMAGANALTGDGTAVGTNNSLIAAGMSVERCVCLVRCSLIAAGVSVEMCVFGKVSSKMVDGFFFLHSYMLWTYVCISATLV